MGDVFLDGEKVDFQGSAPGSVVEVWTAVEQHLADTGRVLERVRIDGEPCQPEEAMACSSYRSIDFESLKISEKLLAMGKEWRAICRQSLTTEEKLASAVLAFGWDESQKRAIEFLESFRPCVEGFALIEEFSRQQRLAGAARFTQAYAASVEAMENAIGAVQSQDCVKLSDQLALEFRPRWSDLLSCLDDELLPSLQTEVDDD